MIEYICSFEEEYGFLVLESMKYGEELIRCKDCKFVGTDATCCLVCKRDGMGLKPFHVYHDDYCSYAERKEE